MGGTAMKSNATKILVLICALGLLFSATPVRAQVSGATLSGTITDAQGGAVVGAKISAKNGATGVTTESTTNSSGAFSIVNLLPADYEVSISAAGFRTALSKVTLAVGGQQALNLALTVGEVSQTVEVTGAAPVVETTNATLSGEVVGSQIQELPLNGRDWVTLATLTPGVAQIRPHELVTQPGGSTRGLGIQMSINGDRPQQNVYRLNGVIVNDYSNAGPGNVLGANAGVDAIQEFSVLTGNYSAEYGFTSGGVINAITKSGTNSFHGSVYEFLRNDVLDAKDRFEDPTPQNPAGFPKGLFERNQFGASGGWKVLRDRAFLFGNYEGLRQVQALPQTGSVLTPNARMGILNDANGVQLPALQGACPYAAYDPNGMTNEAPGQAAVCVDNFIYAEINPCTGVTPCPSGAPPGVLSPLPNGALVTGGVNNINNNNNAYYTSDIGEYTSDNYATVRGDLKISDKDSLTGSWYRDTSTWKKPGLYSGTSASFGGFLVPHGAYTAEETHIFSPTLVNTARLGLDFSDLQSPAFSNANPVTHATTLCVVPPAGGTCADQQIGILPGWVAGGGSIGGNGNSGNSISVSGPQGGFTGAAGFSARTKKIEAFEDVSMTIGKHSLKIGVMYLDDHENWLDGPALPGGGGPSYGALSGKSYGACPTITSSTTNTTANPLPLSCGGGAAAFLMDISHTVRMPVEPPFITQGTVHHYRSQVYGAYFQDDWKMASNLTVNLGIRYEMSTIPTEVDDKIDNLYSISQTVNGTDCVANAVGIAVCQGYNNKTFLHNPTLRNFEPRVGFAWDPFHDGKTSIRGGAGIFDILPMSYMFALNSMQTVPNGEIDLSYGQEVPNGAVVAGNPTCTGATNCLPIGVGLPSGWGRFPTFEAQDAITTTAATGRYGYIEPNPHRPYVAQYNLNIQRQITPTLAVMVAYAGSRSWHDPFQIDDLNQVQPYAVATSSGGTRYIWPNPVGSGCFPVAPNCSQTDANLKLPIAYANSASNASCVAGVVSASSSCISANNGIVPGLLINSNVAQIQSSLFIAQSWYDSLQVKVDKKVSHGLMMGGSFTWGKSFDTSSSSFASDNYANNPSAITPYFDLSKDKGLSDFNVTRSVSINGLYAIPTPASWHGIMQSAARGWGIGANFLMSDGIPLWPLMVAGDSLGILNGGAYDVPDLVPGCNLVLPNYRQTLNYINPACYTVPQAPSQAFYNGSGTIGTAGYNPGCDPQVSKKTGIAAFPFPNCINLMGNDPRNIVIGPGLINLDLSVTKDTYIKRISETANLQFRAEMFNLPNRTNFAFPSAGNLGSLDASGKPVPGFGTLSNTQSPNRQLQFALKLLW
jgi:hypothetical protein